MRKIFQFLVIAFSIVFFSEKVQASHVAAADIFYEYISPLNYKVHLILYRDCKPGNATLSSPYTNTQGLHVYSLSCNQDFNVTLDTTGNNTNHMYGDLCPNIDNWCVNSTSIFPGYEEWEYTANVTLPMACTDWVFAYDNLCCRNNAISNLVGASGAGLCISAGLNNVVRPVNSSPRLTIKPIPYVCVNQPKVYLNGPIDPNLDSLFFIAQQPLNSGSCAPITWSGTSTTANPLGAAAPGGYVIDPVSGTASFTPTAINTYVLAFKCFDIDQNTGDTVGYVMRDVQINVLNCNAAPPSDPNLTQNYQLLNLQGATMQSPNPIVLNVCPGSQMSFDVKGVSNSGSNQILTAANNAASCPGSTYTSNPIGGGNPVTGTFTWTPNALQIGTHTLIIEFKDSTCTVAQPIVLKSYCVVTIKVLPGVDAGPDIPYCLSSDSIQFNVTAPAGITQWSWTDINLNTANIGLSSLTIQNPKAAPSATTSYVVTALNPPPGLACKIKDTVVVNVFPGIQFSAGGNHTICANDSILMTASASPNQINPIIRWRPNVQISDTTILNPWVSPMATQEYKLYYTDDNGCKYTDSSTIIVDGIRAYLNALSSENNICPNYPFQLYSNAAAMQCGLSVFQCSSAETVKTVGTGNVQQSQFAPYYTNYYDSYKSQFLFTAAELQAAGVRAGNLNSISWNVVSKASDTIRNATISIGCTTDTALNGVTGFVSGLSPVLFMDKYYSHLNWNEHVFTNPYFWDGMSNLVVQICYNATANSSLQDVVACSNTTNTQSMFQYQYTGGIGCNLTATTPLIGSVRPNTRFKICESGNLSYAWTPGASLDNTTIKDPYSSGVTNTTDFIVTVTSPTNPNCISKDTVQVIIDNSNSVTASVSPQVICQPGLVTLTGTPAGSGPRYECGEENVNCIAPYNQYVLGAGVNSAPPLTPFNGGTPGQKAQILFTVADLNSIGIFKGKIDAIALEVLTKTSTFGFNMNVAMGCTNLTDLNGGLLPSTSMKNVYTNANYNTVVGMNSIPLTTPFVWDGTQSLVVEFCFYNGFNTYNGSGDPVPFIVGLPTAQYAYQVATNAGCDINPTTTFVASTIRPNVTFSFCDIPVKTWEYKWTPSTFVFDSTAGVTTAYVDQSKTFFVHTKGGNKCDVFDSVSVILSQHDVRAIPIDTTVCLGDAFQAYAYGSGNAPSESFIWYNQATGGTNGLSCANCPNPVITPATNADSVFVCVRIDSYNCNDTAYVHVNVNATPVVTILNGDEITIKYLQEVNLIATGASVYNWTPVWGTSNPNMPNTIVSPQETTTYTVYGINQFGCGAWDSIRVNIDYQGNLFVPSAFTPNADGTNDVFKIANFTFQKVQEFKVLNRWGQVVFSADDNRGWNGTFKGVNQDPGVYYYLIRVAYPDGPTKLFKGDVTLIR